MYYEPMKCAFVCAALAAVVCSQASFELAMVLDTNPAGSRVHRFDPETGAYYGYFGLGMVSGGVAMTSDRDSGLTYVSTGSYVRAFDHNAGTFVRSYYTTTRSLANCAYGIFGVSAAGGLIKLDPTSSTFWTVPRPSGTSFSWITAGIDGSLLALDHTNGDIYRGTGLSAPAGVWTRIFDGSPSAFGSTVHAVSFLYGSQYNEILCGATAPNVLRWIDYSAGYSSFVGTNVYPPIATLSNIVGLAAAHTGVYILGTPSSGQQPVLRWDGYVQTLYGFGSSQVVNPVAISTVLAPEPASLGALALGVFVLARRRRR